MSPTGVLVSGFGGPETLEAVRPFMCALMGREPSHELVTRVCERYKLIGGGSPLPSIASSIAARLATELESLGKAAPVEVGMLYSEPSIAGALSKLAEKGCDAVVVVSLSPFESKVAQGATREVLRSTASAHGIGLVREVALAGEFEAFVSFYTESAREALRSAARPVIAFSAHSLPVSDLVDDDPYEKGLRAAASRVAAGLGLAPAGGTDGPERASADSAFAGFSAYGSADGDVPWFLVFQSKGARPGAWLGPELEELVAASARAGAATLVVVPIGFMTDHMETLYDLDIVAARQAEEAGLDFARARVANDDEHLVAAIARAVSALV